MTAGTQASDEQGHLALHAHSDFRSPSAPPPVDIDAAHDTAAASAGSPSSDVREEDISDCTNPLARVPEKRTTITGGAPSTPAGLSVAWRSRAALQARRPLPGGSAETTVSMPSADSAQGLVSPGTQQGTGKASTTPRPTSAALSLADSASAPESPPRAAKTATPSAFLSGPEEDAASSMYLARETVSTGRNRRL